MAPLLVDRGWVFFEWNGEVYRARESSPLSVTGYPMGARWFGPMHYWRDLQRFGVYPFEQQSLSGVA